jgi:polysaccharide biosynthesis protein PslG
MDFDFVEECLRSGLLNYWSAISVHPYRKMDPESVVDDYARLRKLIDNYAPAGKRVPIISSEWGYSSSSFNVDAKRQAELLARQLLINQSQGIALSIWYDWQDDGSEPTQIEHHFGTVLPTYFGDREPVYDWKPSYQAAQTLSSFLQGYKFKERKPLSAGDYVLAFNNGGLSRFAVWTTVGLNHTVTIPVARGTYRIVSHTGETVVVKSANAPGLLLTLTSAPQYIMLENP